MKPEFLDMLQCPHNGGPLQGRGDELYSDSGERYRVTRSGIPLFSMPPKNRAAAKQQLHYDRICDAYLDNLTYPHTQEYFAYLDRELFAVVGDNPMGHFAEVCCGQGEALELFRGRYQRGVGIDISPGMLEAARTRLSDDNVLFVQGDATCLPFANGSMDCIMTLGGIHHVNERSLLFQEIHRCLRPGGRFIWREPLDDFFLWRWLRAIIYRISPTLDAETERPLRHHDTVPLLEKIGFQVTHWNTRGFLGFCLLMNSDVLIFNRLFRYIPGIRTLARGLIGLDHWSTHLPGLRRAGLQVIGAALKPVTGVLGTPNVTRAA